jgi:hypothetical protein
MAFVAAFAIDCSFSNVSSRSAQLTTRKQQIAAAAQAFTRLPNLRWLKQACARVTVAELFQGNTAELQPCYIRNLVTIDALLLTADAMQFFCYHFLCS